MTSRLAAQPGAPLRQFDTIYHGIDNDDSHVVASYLRMTVQLSLGIARARCQHRMATADEIALVEAHFVTT